jgi:hypothetical protein
MKTLTVLSVLTLLTSIACGGTVEGGNTRGGSTSDEDGSTNGGGSTSDEGGSSNGGGSTSDCGGSPSQGDGSESTPTLPHGVYGNCNSEIMSGHGSEVAGYAGTITLGERGGRQTATLGGDGESSTLNLTATTDGTATVAPGQTVILAFFACAGSGQPGPEIGQLEVKTGSLTLNGSTLVLGVTGSVSGCADQTSATFVCTKS